ncbi:MAG: N-6 DNA methylase [Desulfobacterales bacterium]|nr:N-6 DNA methylase [Desulfobacterales bacterium]
MLPLDKTLRNKLERTIKDARDIAEDGARAVLQQLGVGEAKPFNYLSEDERNLRRRLRAHGRQLGDLRDSKTETQDIYLLIEEVAYEHWHRMLFARFLAENNLLMYPDPDDPVAVTIEECEDMAADEGAKNGWELAARYAARMLPQIFRPNSPSFELNLPPEHQQKLERLLAGLESDVFLASDSLGWVYQFWQAKRKDEVNASEVKIGARELPAVTQLFTEPYMVSFLLDNSLGAWWAGKILSEKGFKTASSEEELRNKASLDGVPLEYLRFIKNETGCWTPAAGTFDGWPDSLRDFKVLDPCCGSGHFLVAAFLMLVPIRMKLESLSANDAVDVVLLENIHGLEIDKRCVELAAFALALTAWRYPNAGGYRTLPELNIACSGLPVSVAKDEWKQLALDKHNLRIAMDWMYEEFKDAPVLGSLLNPTKGNAAKLIDWKTLEPMLEEALSHGTNDEQYEAGVIAHGLAKTAKLLAGRYNLVITNVPYLARGKQDERLSNFCEKHHPEAKNDLATVFLDRCLELCLECGTCSMVMPQNWLFLTSYKKFREKLLKKDTWHLIARLGPKAFQTPMWDFNVQLITMSRGNQTVNRNEMFGEMMPNGIIRGVDISKLRTVAEKANQLISGEIKSVEQAKQLENPDARVAIDILEEATLLLKFADGFKGFSSGDMSRFIHLFWESSHIGNGWVPYQGSIKESRFFDGRSQVLLWESGAGAMVSEPSCYIKGRQAWGKKGITVTQMGSLPATLYEGDMFDENAAAIVPYNHINRAILFCFITNQDYSEFVRKIDAALKVTNKTLVKVPFDIDHWKKISKEKYPNGLPKPYTDDPTQWIFHGHPCGSVIWAEEKKWTAYGTLRTNETVLQVAVARLLGYRWPTEFDSKMELSDEQREWVNRCEALLPYANEDGIVCIPPLLGEAAAAERLLNLLAASYGSEWTNDTLSQLLKQSDHAGKSLETWLRDKFFIQHCKLFQHRPFIWHIWDGLRDGFAVLLNYHKLDSKLMETLIYTYLGDWINRQKQDIVNGIDGAQEKLAAAQSLKKKLELILEGEAPYDIFVRWKPIEKQPIGWNPDINDGVRLNIRPFMSVPDIGKKGAGVLRDKPNINWNKDRGKDVESAPWYHMFKGDRINDHHLSLSEKLAAQKAKEITI